MTHCVETIKESVTFFLKCRDKPRGEVGGVGNGLSPGDLLQWFIFLIFLIFLCVCVCVLNIVKLSPIPALKGAVSDF